MVLPALCPRLACPVVSCQVDGWRGSWVCVLCCARAVWRCLAVCSAWGWGGLGVGCSELACSSKGAGPPAQKPAQELPPSSSSLTLRHTLDLAGHSRQRCRGQAVDFQLAQQAGTPGSVPAWQHHYTATSSSQQGVGGLRCWLWLCVGPPVGVCLEPAFTCHLPAVCLLGRASC